MTVFKNVLKITAFVLLVGVIIGAIFLFGVFALNVYHNENDYDYLQSRGYVNMVKAKDLSLNVVLKGNDNGKHTIVCLAGLGCSDFSVTASKMTNKLADDNRIAFIDRPGCGMSNDTDKKMTNEYIVENCRAALEKSEIEAPYILLAHSISGAYATYWESKYPDEVEAVVFIDSTPLSSNNAFTDEPFTKSSGFTETINVFESDIGLYRLGFKKQRYPLPDIYTEDDQKISDALILHNGISKAYYSEILFANENCRQAFNEIVTNEIPKLYIDATNSIASEEDYRLSEDWIKELMPDNTAVEPSVDEYDKLVADAIEQAQNNKQTILDPYFEALGNVEYEPLPGYHYIYQQYPDECAELISVFIIMQLDN